MADGKVTIVVDVDGNKVKVLNDELDKTAQQIPWAERFNVLIPLKVIQE